MSEKQSSCNIGDSKNFILLFFKLFFFAVRGKRDGVFPELNTESEIKLVTDVFAEIGSGLHVNGSVCTKVRKNPFTKKLNGHVLFLSASSLPSISPIILKTRKKWVGKIAPRRRRVFSLWRVFSPFVEFLRVGDFCGLPAGWQIGEFWRVLVSFGEFW